MVVSPNTVNMFTVYQFLFFFPFNLLCRRRSLRFMVLINLTEKKTKRKRCFLPVSFCIIIALCCLVISSRKDLFKQLCRFSFSHLLLQEKFVLYYFWNFVGVLYSRRTVQKVVGLHLGFFRLSDWFCNRMPTYLSVIISVFCFLLLYLSYFCKY